jgi:hypothetical protein
MAVDEALGTGSNLDFEMETAEASNAVYRVRAAVP